MRSVGFMSLVLVSASLSAQAATLRPKAIEFPCFKNLADGRVLVDGAQWDRKMQDLGYALSDGAFVPWKVLAFTRTKTRDAMWADGICRMQLLPVEK